MVSQEISINSKLYWTWQGHQIAYSVTGEGMPLVLVHGFGASIGHWRKNIPVWAEAGYKVFAIDLLGFGNSDKPAIAYSLDVWQELLKDFWLSHIQVPTVFIGNSIGALLSLMMAANHAEMVKGAVLLNVAGGLNHRPNELNPVLGMIMLGFSKLVGSPLTGRFIFNQVRQKHRIKNTLAQVYCDRTAITDELVDLLYLPSCDDGAQTVFASILTAPAGAKPEELLPKVSCPLLVLWGEADPWTPIKGAQIFKDRAKSMDIKVISISKTGHCPHDENPQVVNPEVITWLEDLFGKSIN
jgi:pimeloyl-ACP methyl ester carboxylesterase